MKYDDEIIAIADYVGRAAPASSVPWQTAKWCLLDSLGCALAASHNPHCQKLLGPVYPNQNHPLACPVLGTSYRLDPIRAAWNNGLLIRWLDYNDTWLAAEWGHPSDNLGAILSAAYSRTDSTVRDICGALIKAYEIQGILALENSFNQRGWDHVILVKVAATAVATALLGGDHEQVCAALSHAFVDGAPLRTYRHAPNTGPRKSWASGDACGRALQIAQWVLAGEPGYPQVLTTPKWGFHDVVLGGASLKRSQPYQSYVVENILFKVAFPAEFHGQTAVECALTLYPDVKAKLNAISKIEIKTQRAAMDIINKQGPLKHVADRDHSLQYMTAVALMYGELTAAHYEDEIANNPLIDALRTKMVVTEDANYTKAYYDPSQRAIANAIRIHFQDGTQTDWCEQYYPLGHQRRRAEAIPLLKKKFIDNSQHYFSHSVGISPTQVSECLSWWDSDDRFFNMPTKALLDMFSLKPSRKYDNSGKI